MTSFTLWWGWSFVLEEHSPSWGFTYLNDGGFENDSSDPLGITSILTRLRILTIHLHTHYYRACPMIDPKDYQPRIPIRPVYRSLKMYDRMIETVREGIRCAERRREFQPDALRARPIGRLK